MTTDPVSLQRAPVIDLLFESPLWHSHQEILTKAVETTLTIALEYFPEIPTEFEICVLFSDDTTVQRMNQKFRKKDTATNVLSFPQIDMHQGEFIKDPPVQNPFPLGDIVLSYETIDTESRTQKIPLLHHVQHLVVHGFLHLLGFDHMENEEAEIMETLEGLILKNLGIQNPYLDQGNN